MYTDYRGFRVLVVGCVRVYRILGVNRVYFYVLFGVWAFGLCGLRVRESLGYDGCRGQSLGFWGVFVCAAGFRE